MVRQRNVRSGLDVGKVTLFAVLGNEPRSPQHGTNTIGSSSPFIPEISSYGPSHVRFTQKTKLYWSKLRSYCIANSVDEFDGKVQAFDPTVKKMCKSLSDRV